MEEMTEQTAEATTEMTTEASADEAAEQHQHPQEEDDAKADELAALRERVAYLEGQLSAKTESTATRHDLPGVPTSVAREEYFSPAEVRAMSPREVRENYDRIFESMRHWQ